jgi:translocation and assembly module TamB
MLAHGVPPPRTNVRHERQARLRRWAGRALAGILLFVGVALVALLIAARSLDRPWLKQRVQGAALEYGGVDVDYRTLQLHWLSGLTIEDLVVRSPEEVRAFAPDLLRAGHVEAQWSFASLRGHGPRVERLAIADLALTVVMDEHGRTSFDAMSGETPVPAPHRLPLSHRAAGYLGAAPIVGHIDVARASLALVRTDQGHVFERTTMGGVAATASAEPASAGWQVHAELGSPASPLELGVARDRDGVPAGTGRARLWLAADASSSALSAAVDVQVLEQTFVADLGRPDWLHAEASARFDPAAGMTTVTVERTVLAGGAATTEGSVEVPDAGDPVVRHAQGDVDVARLLAFVPAGLVPLTAERAHLHYEIDAFVAGAILRFAEGGSLAVDAEVANVKLPLAAGTIQVDGGKLTLHLLPAPGAALAGVVAKGNAHVDGLRFDSGSDRLDVHDLALDLDGRQAADGALTGRAEVRFARLDDEGKASVAARDGRCELHAEGLYAGATGPLETRGDVVVSLGLSSFDGRSGTSRVGAEGVLLRMHSRLEGVAPYAAEIAGSASRLRLFAASESLVAEGPAHVDVHLHDVFPDTEHPVASRGVVQATVDFDAERASLDATKGADSVDFAVRASATSLKGIRPLLSPGLAKAAPWDSMALAVHSSGRIERLASGDPELDESTELQMDRPAYGRTSAHSLSFTVRSRGSARHHQADADLRLQGLAIEGGVAGDERIGLGVVLDRGRPSLGLHLETEGRASSKLSASFSFDRARRAVVYDLDGRLAGLAPLAPLLAGVSALEGFDLSKLDLGLKAKGALLGVVSAVAGDGSIRIEPHPTRTVGLEGIADVHVANLRWEGNGTAVATEIADWHGEMRVDGGKRMLDSRLTADAVHLGIGRNVIDLAGVVDDASGSLTGDVVDPEVSLTQHGTVRAVEQDFVPEYPVGGVDLTMSVDRDPEGLIHVSALKIANVAGGTTIDLTGGLDLGTGRHRLSLTVDLTQDLALLSSDPARFAGQGSVAVGAKVESPDLSVFRTRVDLKVDVVHVQMARAGFDLGTVHGEIPIAATIEIGENGVTIRRESQPNPYSMLRFADQHPFLSRSGFLSIEHLKTPFLSIAPLVGNLEIDQNVISLRQFEMGVRGGRITGECALVWDGLKSSLDMHIRANGVQSSHGEPFDGNIAVVVAVGDRTVDGRAEIQRIGKRHLLDLLDLQDPMRADPAMNRIRSLLGFGYPDRIRLVFDHGFASARLKMGGLAGLFSVGELHGLPMGPIVDKLLAPVLDTKEKP